MTAVRPLVDWCAAAGHRVVAVHSPDGGLRAALSGVVSVIDGADLGSASVDAAIWVDDSASVLPRPDLREGVRDGGDVLVEASLDQVGLVPVSVEVDRVALVSGGHAGIRRIDIVGSDIAVRPIHPWSLTELDVAMSARGFQLHRRTLDWGGGPVAEGAVCHLSWFRNAGPEPR